MFFIWNLELFVIPQIPAITTQAWRFVLSWKIFYAPPAAHSCFSGERVRFFLGLALDLELLISGMSPGLSALDNACAISTSFSQKVRQVEIR